MTKNTSFIALLGLLSLASSARAAWTGWYEVKNYVGTVGTAPVHVSLQTFGYINHGKPSEWRVEGSYYYDTHRTPIPLLGKRQPDGHITLCEAAAQPGPPSRGLTVPGSSKSEVPGATLLEGLWVRCQIALKIGDDSANGEWNDGKKMFPIALHRVGSLNDTREFEPVDGVVEIPMWYHTKTHMLLGVYQTSTGCGLSMSHLRLINIATGRVDNDINLDCGAGLLMTSIFENVSRAETAHQVTVEFGRGQGYEEIVNIEQGAAKGQ